MIKETLGTSASGVQHDPYGNNYVAARVRFHPDVHQPRGMVGRRRVNDGQKEQDAGGHRRGE